jgi:DNA modification methylase
MAGMVDDATPPAVPAAPLEAPFAAYRGVEANGDPALAHIHPGLRHLAVPVDQVLLDPANVNKHPPEQLEVLKGMLRTFGQRAPLITREELAAQLLALHDQGVDVAIIGWDGDDLGALLDERDGAAELPEPDAVEPPETPWTQPGDLFEIGHHRLICGDSTDPATIERLMQGEKAALALTDPPYGIAYVGKSEELAAERKTIANDDLGLDGTRDLVARAARAWPLRPGGVWYVCSPSGDMETAFRFGLVDASERLRQAIAWVKQHFVLGHQDYHYQHETILYGWREGAGHFWCGSRSEVSVWQIDRPSKSADHPTMKPLELLARAIGNSSVRGDIVFDGFGGSGQTLFAAHGLGRRARLVELSPGFCDVIARRARELGLEVIVDRPGVGRIPWGEALAA